MLVLKDANELENQERYEVVEKARKMKPDVGARTYNTDGYTEVLWKSPFLNFSLLLLSSSVQATLDRETSKSGRSQGWQTAMHLHAV
jgi:hypothetical protein